jgi:hypothetical protein
MLVGARVRCLVKLTGVPADLVALALGGAWQLKALDELVLD